MTGVPTTGAAERRRGIELVLERRPDVDLDELQRLLAKAGVVVDTDTLVADLDALGYEVDDEDEAEAPGRGAPPVAAPPAAPPAGVDRGERNHRDDADRPERPARPVRSLIVVAIAVLVAIVVIAVFFVDDEEDPLDSGLLPDTAPLPEESDSTVETRLAPEGPGSDPALDVPETLTDDFERAGIGDFPGVSTWDLLSGEWANSDGNLEPVGVPDDGPAVAALDVTGDVRAQVQVDRPSSHAGLAFRIVDDRNLFLWAPVPEFGSVILFEVVDGQASPVTDSGLIPESDGMPALGINLVGDTVELLHEGVVVTTYDLPPSSEETRIGVGALPGADEPPLFDEYRVLEP